MIGQKVVYTSTIQPQYIMTNNAQLKFRVPRRLRAAAHEAARQNGIQLSTLVRIYLEAYISNQPIK